MRNEEIKTLIEGAISGRDSLCKEHGEAIATLLSRQKSQDEKLDTLIVRQSTWMDKAIELEMDVLVIKTERKTAIAVIGLVCSAIGGLVVLGFKKIMNII